MCCEFFGKCGFIDVCVVNEDGIVLSVSAEDFYRSLQFIGLFDQWIELVGVCAIGQVYCVR